MSSAGKLLAGLLLTLGVPVPVATAAVWPGLVAQHPLLTTALLAVYEGALLGIALVPRGPLRRRANQLVETIDQALGKKVSRYGHKYLKYVLTTQQFVDMKGLGVVGEKTPELDRIYVHVALARRPPGEVPGGVTSGVPPGIKERHSIHSFLDQSRRNVLAVLGVPGSGKTTLLQHVARRAADPKGGKRHRPFPILLLLRDHSARIAADPNVPLPTLLREDLPELSTKEPDGWWESKLHGGQCLILLDGLDEVARPEHRSAVVTWIKRQIDSYSENDFVITSRPHAYDGHVISGALALQVRPFTYDQVRAFVYGWYRAAERDKIVPRVPQQDHQQAEQRATQRAEQQAKRLLTRLADKPELFDLAVNPLLLTMIALVHRYRSALPDGRAELYREICDVIVWRWREAKQPPADLGGRVMLKALADLAFTIMEQQAQLEHPTWYISGDGAQDAILPVLRRARRNRDNTATATDEEYLREIAKDFLEYMSTNGLLIELKHDQYAFAHHTLAEYLAAQHIREHRRNDILVRAVDDVWWRETTRMYVADADADPVVQACLDSGTFGALALAYECEELTAGLAPELGKRLDQIRAEAFSPAADRDRRRLVAGVLATSHFSRLVPGGNDARLCPHPVTTDLYYLFRRDVPGPYPDGAADLAPDPPRPVTGVSYTDAQQFVQWLNGVVSSDASHGSYRLPTPDEVNHVAKSGVAAALPLTESTAPLWTTRSTGQPSPELWSPNGRAHPRTITAANIHDTAARDAANATLLLHVSLILAITQAGVWANDHAHDLRRIREQALQRGTPPGTDAYHRAGELARARADALQPAHALSRAVAHDLVHTQFRDATQRLAQALEQAHQTARDLDGPRPGPGEWPIASARDVELADRLVGFLDTALGLARDLDSNCTNTLDGHVGATDLRTIALGPALASSLAHLPEVRSPQWTHLSTTAATFVEHLVAPAVPGGYQTKLSITRLDTSLNTACDAFLQRPPAGKGTADQERRWQEMARQLRNTARPVFTRQLSVTDQPAIIALFPALMLADEAAARGWHGPRKAFLTVAAGITLLTRRTSGEEPPEILILART